MLYSYVEISFRLKLCLKNLPNIPKKQTKMTKKFKSWQHALFVEKVYTQRLISLAISGSTLLEGNSIQKLSHLLDLKTHDRSTVWKVNISYTSSVNTMEISVSLSTKYFSQQQKFCILSSLCKKLAAWLMSEYSSLYFEVLKIKMSYGPRKLISGRKWHVLKQHG